MKITNAGDIIAKFGPMVADPESANEEAQANRLEELMKLKKDDLANMILSYEARKTGGMKVGDLAKMILQDEEFVTASHNDVAEAIRELIPGSNCSHKSVATYVSKKREDWDLPARIQIRTARVKKPVEEEIPTDEEVLDD